ncbi:MAG: RluA family pseudouridine synthase, partial [Burkholderiaceae bacterium]|nr:RluA family pseudouridine synthase [Burkholderiaceae bacterium]
ESFFQRLPAAESQDLRVDYLETATVERIQALEALEAFKTEAHARKVARHQSRTETLSVADTQRLARESQQDSRRLAQLKSLYQRALDQEARAHNRFQSEMIHAERHQWQRRLRAIELTNPEGKKHTLDSLLKGSIDNEGQLKAILRTGLPALLHFAQTHRLKPLDWGTFWWGECSTEEIRIEGEFYAFPKERHQTLLTFMSQGLKVAVNPLAIDHFIGWKPEIVYEDDDLVAVNKPAGMLSVPGKAPITNVYETIQALYPNATGPMLLHRLDMSTSGVLLFAKTKEAHKTLQQAFVHQEIQKSYIALLEKPIENDQGTVDFPMCLNPFDRPRQKLDRAYGRQAITEYKVIETTPEYTRIAFYPITGRSHQLRVHAAHKLGLASPIIGDELYGHAGPRLYLHAQSLTFTHPTTGETVTITAPCPF